MQHGQFGVGRGEWLGVACGAHCPRAVAADRQHRCVVAQHAVEDVAGSRLENLLPATKDVGALGDSRSEFSALCFDVELLEPVAVYRQPAL